MVENDTYTAWGDESANHIHAKFYLLGATVIDDAHSKEFIAFKKLKPNKSLKLHWYSMNDSERKRSLKAIKLVSHRTWIVKTPMDNINEKRARAKSLQALLAVLDSVNIDHLILESVTSEIERRDIVNLFAWRRAGQFANIRIDHAPGKEHPQLWLIDQILGAYNGLCSRKEPPRWLQESWKEISSSVTIECIDPE